MSQPDVSAISGFYATIHQILGGAKHLVAQALGAAITTFLGGLDGGFIGQVITWAIERVLSFLVNLKEQALAIALRCEYLKRAGRVSVAAASKAWNLTNKCSVCRCIGHNKQNHPSNLQSFIQSAGLTAENISKAASMVDAETDHSGFFG